MDEIDGLPPVPATKEAGSLHQARPTRYRLISRVAPARFYVGFLAGWHLRV